MIRGMLAGLGAALVSAIFALLLRGMTRGGVNGAAAGLLGFGVCLAIGLGIFAATGRLGELRAAWREDGRTLLLIGLISSAANVAAPIGLQYASAGTWGVLTRLDVAFSLAIGWIFLRERPGAWGGVGTVLMLGGALALTHSRALSGGSQEWIGIALFVLGALAVAVNGFLIKRVLRRRREDVVALANLCCINVALAVLAAVLVPPGGWQRLASWPAGMAAGVLAGVVLVPAFVWYYHSLRALPLWAARLTQLALPASLLLAEWLLFGEAPGPRQLAGIAAIAAGFACVVLGLAARSTNGKSVGWLSAMKR